MENKRLTIRNYEKIRGLCYYDDGSWLPLYPTSVRGGGKAHIDRIEETDDHYRIRLIYIQPQPESATITIERNPKDIVLKPMYGIQMDKGNKLISKEYWTINQFKMHKLLIAVKVWLID